jgi:lantibiotic modifying enzyme
MPPTIDQSVGPLDGYPGMNDPLRTRCVVEAQRVGAAVLSSAVVGSDETPRRWWDEVSSGVVELTGADVYGGAAGIALALHRLGEASGHTGFRRVATELAQSAAGMRAVGTGLFTGPDGVAAACRALGVEAWRVGLHASSHITGDLINGSAGRLATTHALGRTRRQPVQASALLRAANDMPLGGVAHGSAGLVLVAALVARGWTSAVLDTALGILELERDRVGGSPHAWCNGRLGVEYTHAVVTHAAGCSASQEAADATLGIIEELRGDRDDPIDASLCHGTIGAVCIGRRIGFLTGRVDVTDASQRLLEWALSQVESGEPWMFGSDGQSVRFGLLAGLSGVVAGLVSLAQDGPGTCDLGLPIV